MDLGLVGRTNAGKTALFNLITGSSAEVAPTRTPHVKRCGDGRSAGSSHRRDRRRQDIPRRVRAQVQVVDIPGLAAGAGQGEGLGGKALGELRQMDALIHVIRASRTARSPTPRMPSTPCRCRGHRSRANACRPRPAGAPPRAGAQGRQVRRPRRTHRARPVGTARRRLDAGTPLRMAVDQDAVRWRWTWAC